MMTFLHQGPQRPAGHTSLAADAGEEGVASVRRGGLEGCGLSNWCALESMASGGSVASVKGVVLAWFEEGVILDSRAHSGSGSGWEGLGFFLELGYH